MNNWEICGIRGILGVECSRKMCDESLMIQRDLSS
jgi:hypothetical protein